MCLVDWLREEADDDHDDQHDAEEDNAEVQVVHVLDDRRHAALVAAVRPPVGALPDEAGQADRQADHQAPEGALTRRHGVNRRSTQSITHHSRPSNPGRRPNTATRCQQAEYTEHHTSQPTIRPQKAP